MERIRVGAFELDRPIGVGGMGEVWLGEHVEGRIPVAAKLVRELSDKLRAVFRREVEAVAALDHPGIVMVYDHGELTAEAAEASEGRWSAGSPWLVMELASGGTLEGRPLPTSWAELRGVLLSILDGLAHAHARGVVHRDLKPANVLVCEGSDLRPGIKLADFGLALAIDAMDVHAAGAGTPAYMAPEQVLGHWWDFGPWTDLYALGGIAWQLATGGRLYPGDDPKKVGRMHVTRAIPKFEPRIPVPSEFEEWLRALLEKQPERRPDSAAWCAAELLTMGPAQTGLGGTPVPSPVQSLYTLVPPTGLEDELLDDIPTLHTVDTQVHPPAGKVAAIPSRRLQPPPDWRTTEAFRPRGLTRAGLGLFGVRPPPFVGRAEERAQLWALVRQMCRERTPRVAVIRAPAGYGASRLAEWVGQRAAEVGAVRLLSVGHAVDGGPQQGAATLVELVARLRGVPAPEAKRRARRVGVDADTLGALTRGEALERPVELALRMVLREAEQGPVVLWLDDAHLAEGSFALARSVLDAGAAREVPILILLTVDDDALARNGAVRGATERLVARDGVDELQLGPLKPPVLARMVQQMLPLARAAEARVVSIADGSPLVATQLVGGWVQSGEIRATVGGFAPTGRVVPPEDLQALWAARLEPIARAWTDVERRSVELAAVLGSRVRTAEWERACELLLLPPAESAVDDLVRAGLVRRGSQGFQFARGLVRMAVLQRVEQRDELELAAAEVVSPDDPDRLGRHLLAGGRPLEAWPLLYQALCDRQDNEAPGAALWLCEQADAALEQAGVPRTDVRWGRVAVRRVSILFSDWRLEDAGYEAKKVELLAMRHGWPEERLMMIFLQGTACFRLHRLNDAWDHFQRCIDLAEPGSFRHAQAIRGTGQVAQARGDYELAAELYGQYRSMAEALGSDFLTASAHNDVGNAAMRLGRVQEALEHFEKGVALCEAAGFQDAAIGRLNVMGALISLEQHDEAHRRAVAALDQSEEVSSLLAVAGAHVIALRTSAETGDEATWNRVASRIRALLVSSRMVDASVALTCENGGTAAARRGWPGRARFSYEVARQQWVALGKPENAARIDALLADLQPSIGS